MKRKEKIKRWKQTKKEKEMRRRNLENTMKIVCNEFLYSIEFWGILIIVAILFAGTKHNYFPLACVGYGLVKTFQSENLHFQKSKLTKFILKRYSYTVKLVLAAILVAVIMSSWFSFGNFIFSLILSICYTEYMKLFEQRKSLI